MAVETEGESPTGTFPEGARVAGGVLDTPESFGRLVVGRGLATLAEVEECIALQAERARQGDFLRLGQVFVERGILSAQQVRDILCTQRVAILVCSRCRTQFNLNQTSAEGQASAGRPAPGSRCPRCEGELVVPAILASIAVEDTLERSPGLPEAAALPRPLAEVARVFGPFEIIGEISRGGMGIVYKARDAELDRTVALKVLLAGRASAAEDVDRFEREARAVARLRHPAIVEIHQIGRHHGIHYFSMNYIQGISLEKLIEEGKTSVTTMIEVVHRIADAVEYAHRNGVIHRDIKPTNILVNQRGEPFLIDFGIAKFREDMASKTKSGTFLGSPQYMAPEYISGRARRFDTRSDVYSLGITLYKVLTGQTPFGEGDTVQILHRVLGESPPPVDLVTKVVDREIAAICMKAIERNPDDRYTSAGDLAADLKRYLRGDDVSVRPRGPIGRVRRWLRSRASIVFNLALSVSLVIVFWILHSTAETQGRRADELERQLRESELQVKRLQYEALLDLGERHIARDQTETALVVLGRAIQLQPERPEGYGLRAELLERMGRATEAATDRAKLEQLQHP